MIKPSIHTINLHLSALLARLEDSDFSTKPEDRAVRAAIERLRQIEAAEEQARANGIGDGL